MVEAFESRGVPLFIAYYRRGQERFLKARDAVASGQLGELTSLQYTMVKPAHAARDGEPLPWRLRAEEAGGGLMMDVGCHTIDIIDFLVGPLANVNGAATRALPEAGYLVEDSVALTATFGPKNAALASMSWSFVGPPSSAADQIVIRGTEGELRLSTFGSEPVQVTTFSRAGVPTTEEFSFERPAHVHQPLVQTIVDELRAVPGAKCPSRGDNASRVAEAIDQVLSQYYDGRSDDFWARSSEWPGAAA